MSIIEDTNEDRRFLVHVMTSSGILQNFFIAKSHKQYETVMKIFYPFPYYANVYEISYMPSVDNMMKVMNDVECFKSGMDDVEVRMKISNDRTYDQILGTVNITDSEITNKNGEPLDYIDSIKCFEELNKCYDCEDGTWLEQDLQDAGHFEPHKCESCDGTGLINNNL